MKDLRVDSWQLSKALKYTIFHGPCTKSTYVKRPLTSPNHTRTTIHFMLLSGKCWVDQEVVRWLCGGMETMMGEWSFQSQSHLKAQKKRSVSIFVHVKHFLYIRHSHKKHVEVVLKMHCHRIYKHGDIKHILKNC